MHLSGPGIMTSNLPRALKSWPQTLPNIQEGSAVISKDPPSLWLSPLYSGLRNRPALLSPDAQWHLLHSESSGLHPLLIGPGNLPKAVSWSNHSVDVT